MTDDGGRIVHFPGPRQGGRDLFAVLEALLFAAGEPVSERALAEAAGEVSRDDVRRALRALSRRIEAGDRGLELVQVAGGWQLRTDPRFSEQVASLLGGTPPRLSQAALETLSIVAYRQPVTRAGVEALRGVASGGVLRTLIDRGLVRVVGRRDEPGRPMEYGTTRGFLETFGLPDLASLPTLRDLEDLEDD